MSYIQWRKVQGWGGQFHTNQCNFLSKASIDHRDAGDASLTWHVYPSLSPAQSFLMHGSTVSHARLSGSTTSLYHTLSLTEWKASKRHGRERGGREVVLFCLLPLPLLGLPRMLGSGKPVNFLSLTVHHHLGSRSPSHHALWVLMLSIHLTHLVSWRPLWCWSFRHLWPFGIW